jgi:outer membrane receptor protein involved in Fe transport
VWDFGNGATTLKANYNKGFKPPSFFALGFPIGANPDLAPERSENAELTLAHRFDAGLSAQIAAFRIEYTDLVDFDPTTFSYVNRGTVVVKGIEPALDVRLGERLRAQLGLTLLDIDERDDRPPLRNRPQKRASASVLWQIDDRSSLFAALSATGRFLDRSNPTGDIELPGFATVDLVYAFERKPYGVKLALDNAFDKRYEPFVGFPGVGRRLRAEARFDF